MKNSNIKALAFFVVFAVSNHAFALTEVFCTATKSENDTIAATAEVVRDTKTGVRSVLYYKAGAKAPKVLVVKQRRFTADTGAYQYLIEGSSNLEIAVTVDSSSVAFIPERSSNGMPLYLVSEYKFACDVFVQAKHRDQKDPLIVED